MYIASTTWRAARRALEKAAALYLEDPNVSLIDLGFRQTAATANDRSAELVVRVHVRQKLSGKAFQDFAVREPHRVIDAQRLGFAIEVIEANYDLHLRSAPPCREPLPAIKLAGGNVRDRQSGAEMLLTSWHAVAASHPTGASFLIGRFAETEKQREPNFSDKYLRNAIHAGLDAAILAKPANHEPAAINEAAGVVVPQLGMPVMKSGSSTSGIITGILGYAMLRDTGVKQIIGPLVQITPEASSLPPCGPGDSGAWWLETATRRAAALHFAGSAAPHWALAFSMPEVLEALEVDIVAPTAIIPASQNLAAHSQSNWMAPLKSARHDATLTRIVTTARPRLISPRLFITFSFFFAVALIGFDRHLTQVQQRRQTQTAQLQKELQFVKTLATLDSARQQQINRVIALIDRFNPNLNGALKLEIATEIYAMSFKYCQLDVELICATITHETGRTWDSEAISFAGAMGLMQILPSTGMELARQEGITWISTEAVLFDPLINIRLGCRYLNDLIARFGLEAGLAGYNGGERQARFWLNGGRTNKQLALETAAYVPAILKLYREFRGKDKVPALASSFLNTEYRRTPRATE